jgi:hypothetical protein
MAEFTNPFAVVDEAAARRKRLNEQNSILAQRTQSNTEYANQYRDSLRQYQQGMDPRVSGFAKRGLGRSGIFQRAMKDYALNQQNQLGQLASTQASQENALQLQEQQSAQILQEFLDRQQIAKAQQIADAASSLQDWSPFTGLYS